MATLSCIEWVVGWFAWMFQHPSEKLDTALAIRGVQGCGKTLIGKLIGDLLGPHYVLVADSRFVVGHFNAHLEALLLLQADEAFWAGDKRAAGVLRNLVTSEKLLIERKGIQTPIPSPNYVRLFITSNSEHVVPAGFEERRFAVLQATDRKAQDHRYFAELLRHDDEWRRPAALLYHLLTVDLDKAALSQIPETEALDDQKQLSQSVEHAWLEEIPSNGAYLPGDRWGQGVGSMTYLFPAYEQFRRASGQHYGRYNERRLGLFLTVYSTSPKPTRGSEHGTADGSGFDSGQCWRSVEPFLVRRPDTGQFRGRAQSIGSRTATPLAPRGFEPCPYYHWTRHPRLDSESHCGSTI